MLLVVTCNKKICKPDQKVAFQSKADHPRTDAVFCCMWPWSWPDDW